MLFVKASSAASASARLELKRALATPTALPKHSALPLAGMARRSLSSTSSTLTSARMTPASLTKPAQSRRMQTATTSAPHVAPPPPTPVVAPAAAAAAHSDEPSVGITQDTVCITWSSGVTSRFHHFWLRDHCRCPICYHQKTKQRLLNTFEIPADVQALSAEATTEGLVLSWPSLASSAHSEPHTSVFPWSWLRDNSYAPVLQLGAGSAINAMGADARGRVLWGRGIGVDPPTVTYEEVQEERGVAKWCAKIARYGFCLVSGVPPTPEATQGLVERIAFIRPTHYGGFWDFTSNLEHGDTAYTNLALGAHTDTTYLTDPCGLQLFHLLSHEASEGGDAPSGGASLLVDGFLAAQVLREVHPEAYRVLSTTRILTHSAGDDATLVRPLHPRGYPILQHDSSTGELIQVRYNNDDRSVLKISEHEVIPFYEALRKWHEIITSPDGEYWTQLTPGTALIFDNHRTLHGRSSFVGARRLSGAYVAHDDFRSRTAVLQSRFPDVFADGPRVALKGDDAHPSRGVWDDGL